MDVGKLVSDGGVGVGVGVDGVVVGLLGRHNVEIVGVGEAEGMNLGVRGCLGLIDVARRTERRTGNLKSRINQGVSQVWHGN